MSKLKVGDTVMIVKEGDGAWSGEPGTVARIAFMYPQGTRTILLFRTSYTCQQSVEWWPETRLPDFGLRIPRHKGYYQFVPADALMVIEPKENDED